MGIKEYMKNIISNLKQVFLIVAAALLGVFALSSCLKDDIAPWKPDSSEEANVLFSFNVPGNSGITKAMGLSGENDIKTIDVLVFQPEGGFIGISGASEIGTADPYSPWNREFVAKLPVGTYDLVFIVNARKYISECYADTNGIIPYTHKPVDVAERLQVSVSGKWLADRVSYEAIPMAGMLKSAIVTEGTKLEKVKLTRMLAKVDLKVGSEASDKFRLSSVRIYNCHNAGFVLPESFTHSGVYYSPHIPARSKTFGPLQYDDVYVMNSGLSYEGEIYLFESESGTSPDSSLQDYLDNTCIVMGGYYGEENYTEESYYRVDFYKDGRYIPLLRNHYYEINIRGVSGPGALTPEIALREIPVNLTAEIVEWKLGSDSDVEIGADHYIGVSQSLFTSSFWQESFDLDVTTTYPGGWRFDGFRISEEADSEEADWITINYMDDYKIVFETADFVVPGSPRVGYIHLTAGNYRHLVKVEQEAIPKAAYFPNSYMVVPGKSVTFPVLKAYIMWDENGEWGFDDPLRLVGNSPYKVSTSVLWSDISDPGFVAVTLKGGDRGKKTELEVKTKALQGNAVVAVHVGPNGDQSDPIRWSWHIWVTEYVPLTLGNVVYAYENGDRNYGFMAHNLGAFNTTSIIPDNDLGLMYQWGRKDPFPPSYTYDLGSVPVETNTRATYGDAKYKPVQNSAVYNVGSIIASTAKDNTLEYSVRYPYRFIGVTNVQHSDWYATDKSKGNGYLWSDENSEKGVFDPCPAGWRVPTYKHGGSMSPWAIWADGAYINTMHEAPNWVLFYHGHNFNRTYGGVWRASGFRNSSEDRFIGVGEVGSYWGGGYYKHSPDSGLEMQFNESHVFPYCPGRRSDGKTIRCVMDVEM